MDLIQYIEDQKTWSLKAFGPGNRDKGIIDHIKKELKEIGQAPGDLMEWVDVVILALDGAYRNGHTSQAIAMALLDKQAINKAREWPDWRTAGPGKAIEHVKQKPSCFGLEYADKGTCCINCPHGHKCHVVINRRTAKSSGEGFNL